MIEIIAGTDRANSNTAKVARIVLADFQSLKTPVGLIDLAEMEFKELAGANYRGAPPGSPWAAAVDRITKADGVLLVVPEYNGSFPGSLKMFIDYWRYPETFEYRPMAFIGLGTRWGGLRPVEHLQQALGYRNSYIFPNRVFISNIKSVLKDGKIDDPLIDELLKVQARDFLRFVKALKDEGLSANSRLKK